MSQTPPRFCQQCGTPLEPGQRFCSNCGTTADFSAASLTERTPDQALAADSAVPPPPPPPADLYTQPAQPSMYAQPPSYTQYPPPAPPPAQGYQQAPVYAAPQKDSSKSVLGQIGCGVLAIILVVLLICGALGYFGWQFIVSNAQTSSTPSSNSTANNSNTGSNQGSQKILATAQINQTVKYSDIDITILNVQQAQSFADDNSTQSGIVRLNTREQNTSSRNTGYLYSDVARLILPDKSAVAPVNTLKYTGPDPATTQTNWWDFPISTSVKISDLTLQLGKDSEAQMDIPLTGKADVSQYQPKTSHPNVQTQYQGLTWTVTDATLSWSADGKEADKGTRYVTVTLKIDNPSSRDFNAYWGDYLRLKAGDTTSAPTGDATIPLGIPAGSSGKTGSASFLMPEGNTSYTLIFLGNTTTGVSQASVDFQI
jgi:cytoskeletal protein RodZ